MAVARLFLPLIGDRDLPFRGYQYFLFFEKIILDHDCSSIKVKMDEQDKQIFNQILIHPLFYQTIQEIKDRNVELPIIPINEQNNFHSLAFPNGVSSHFSILEPEVKYQLNANEGNKLLIDHATVVAYDESIDRFEALEGTAYLTSHAIVLHGSNDFIPSVFLTFNFYTRSDLILNNSRYIKRSEDPERSRKDDYIVDRSEFLLQRVPPNSLLLIDGPLIGGMMSSKTVKLNECLLKKDIIPIFIVKNSTSNIVTDNYEVLRGKFNSDMHWAFKTLKRGERTPLFQYVDQTNPRNAKVFCYLKSYDKSPQRIEFHLDTFEKYGAELSRLLDLIHYLTLVQGDPKNPQVRTIAIAERFARESLKLYNLTLLMRRLHITETMNQNRFGWD